MRPFAKRLRGRRVAGGLWEVQRGGAGVATVLRVHGQDGFEVLGPPGVRWRAGAVLGRSLWFVALVL